MTSSLNPPVRLLTGLLCAVATVSLLGACGPDAANENTVPAVSYEEHMANVRGFVTEAASRPVSASGGWTNYPSTNPFCQGNCRYISWVGGTFNLDSNDYNYNISYNYVVFRNRSYSQSQDPGNYAYVTAAFAAAAGNSSCNGDDIILSFYSTAVASAAAGDIRVKKDWWFQDRELTYIVWSDGWIDMCKGSTSPDVMEFKK